MFKKILAVVMALTLILALATVASAEAKQAEAVYGTPTIDGVIDDMWKNAPEYKVENPTNQVDGFDVATGTARLMWDEKNLYILYVVEDDNVWAQNELNRPWLEDSVCTFFDENNNEVIDAEAGDGGGFINAEGEIDAPGAEVAGEKFTGAVKKTDTGYIVEVKRTFVSIEGKEGHVMGIEFDIADAEDFGDDIGWQRIGQVFWNATVEGVHLDYTLMGKVTFVKASAAVEEEEAVVEEEAAATEEDAATDETTTAVEKPAAEKDTTKATTTKPIASAGSNVELVYAAAVLMLAAGLFVTVRKVATGK